MQWKQQIYMDSSSLIAQCWNLFCQAFALKLKHKSCKSEKYKELKSYGSGSDNKQKRILKAPAPAPPQKIWAQKLQLWLPKKIWSLKAPAPALKTYLELKSSSSNSDFHLGLSIPA